MRSSGSFVTAVFLAGSFVTASLVRIDSGGVAAAQNSRPPAAISGETRALVVFARFVSTTRMADQGVGEPRMAVSVENGLEPLPTYAPALFASNPNPPFADSTVTEYFYRQSNESLILYADVYPRVIESDEPASYYRRSAGRGYGHLAAEIFRKLDPEVDFSLYDTNPKDGVVDQVFIIVRRDEAGTFTGVAHLAGADQVRGRPHENIVVDGVKVDWASSGSFIYNHRPGHIISQSYLVRMIAHEYGHHIWNPRGVFGGHVPAIRNNNVPANNTNFIGYTLMAGRAGGRDRRGDLLISAPEREVLGWLNPLYLRPDTDPVRFVRLGDLYSTGEAVRIDVPLPGDPDGHRVSFYLANRQTDRVVRSGIDSTLRRAARRTKWDYSEPPGCWQC